MQARISTLMLLVMIASLALALVVEQRRATRLWGDLEDARKMAALRQTKDELNADPLYGCRMSEMCRIDRLQQAIANGTRLD